MKFPEYGAIPRSRWARAGLRRIRGVSLAQRRDYRQKPGTTPTSPLTTGLRE